MSFRDVKEAFCIWGPTNTVSDAMIGIKTKESLTMPLVWLFGKAAECGMFVPELKLSHVNNHGTGILNRSRATYIPLRQHIHSNCSIHCDSYGTS
jgi:hypothetical protein